MVDTKPPPPPAFEESGYVNPDGLNYQQWDESERLPELQWPQCIDVYSRMLREDGRVSSVISAIGLPIRQTAWRIDQNGASDEVAEFVARNLGLKIKGAETALSLPRTKGRFSWNQHLQTALLMLTYGHSFFEQVYRIEGEGTNIRAHLRKLAPRPQKTISKINVALDGGLDSIVQRAPQGALTLERMLAGGIEIGVSRLVAYVRDPEPGQWSGNSLLRPAYKHWLLKDELMKIQAGTARRNGMGVPVATGAEGASEEDIIKLQKMASAYKGGANSGVGLPFGADLKLLGVQGNLPDMQLAIEYHDKQIALAGLAHFLNLDRGGSYSLASVLNDTFAQSVQSLAEQIADTANAHIVEDLVDINFGEDAPAPRIVFDEIGSRQDATAAALKTLVDAKILFPDRGLEEYVRESSGLPAKDFPPPPATENHSNKRPPRARIEPDGALTLF
ncbi:MULTISPECIES: DUF935 family protein [unclassified Rhodococcus (in: high G+C Gram-positive bacteria)]|uniref:phage portal protein family protein n=1 Tax=unclassified Rhodococcus (in: high G+C Gram-positive bacteria) TaxID=192944 RepID=UPI00113FFBF7|nr:MULTISPECIES: DUF935 family protein [unclassified Rhodococcus (in: high G+C Gram-positive bacteria)]